MAQRFEEHVAGYINWITHKPGDPTLSILRAHLLFEELLRAYLRSLLPHPDELQGSRLTFAQVLAVVRASSPGIEPDCWIWKAIAELNKLRNMLAHEVHPKALSEKIDAYVTFIEKSNRPLPAPAKIPQSDSNANLQTFTALDMVTLALYYVTADRMNFNLGF